MSKFLKACAVIALIASAFAATTGTADARWRHHGWGHGGYGWGFGPAWGYGYGNPYYRPYYYAGPDACGYQRVRVWRGNHWGIRRVWRCY